MEHSNSIISNSSSNSSNNTNKLVLSKQWFIDSHQGNIKDVYHFVERLGSGGFGVVYLAEHRITSKLPSHLQIINNLSLHRTPIRRESHPKEPCA